MKNFTFYILHFTFCACMAQTAAWDSLRGGAHVVTNEQDTAAMAAIATATNALHEEISAVSGQAASAAALATNGIPETLAGHETRIGALEESAADRPDMSLYALRAEVPQAVDLAPYATTTDVVNRISAAASATALQIETLSRNTASAIASSTNGLPERIASSTNALHTSLAPTISAASTALQPAATNNIPEALASHAGELARLSQALAANTESNTAYRLMSPEGDIYQDATGAVWRVAYATNLSPWHVSVVAYTNGTTTATNEIPGVSTWSITEGESSEGNTTWYLRIPAGGNVYAETMEATGTWTLMFNMNTEVSTVQFDKTNIVTRYWRPADKVLYESSGVSGGLTTNDVCNIVTNETEEGFSEWVVEPPLPSEWAIKWYPGDGASIEGGWVLCPVEEPPSGDSSTSEGTLTSTQVEWSADDSALMRHYVATRTKTPSRNALGLARFADLPQLTNGLATAASVSAANSRAASAQNVANAASNTAANVAGTVAAWETYWDGDEVRVTVTNYYGSQDIPSLYIEEKIENTNAYKVVWDERTRWRTNAVEMAKLRSAIDQKADRAWGYYESHTGDYAPDGYTWLSSPKIAIAGGLAYQRTLTTSGAIWVLASNGMVAQTGGTEDGFFRIKDDEGNTTFEIVRGNKRTVGATAAGIKVTSPRNSPTTTVEIPYNVVSEEHPTIYSTTDLSSGEWTELAATWLGQSGAWTAQVSSASATLFIKGEYETGGETYIKNVAPISAESGIYCTDGIHKVRPVYTNGTVTWEVVQ